MGGNRLSTEQAVVDSFLGQIVILVEGGQVCSLKIVRNENDSNEPPSPGGEVRCPVLAAAVAQLRRYLEGGWHDFDLPLRLSGTVFQKAVWREAAAVPYGTVSTYGHLAARLGRPHAARAVGQALRRNPVPIIVPCHRIVSGGGIGGYTPDPSIKKALLVHEGVADFA